MLFVFLAAALAFAPQDADFAHRAAGEFVEKCTPRDAGTIRGAIAANWILDQASMTGADVRRDSFVAATPVGPRRMTNLYAEFKADDTSRWVVLVSHYDTKPGVKCPGANDGASTSALLIAIANVLADWRTPRGNVMLVWTDGEECRGEHYSEGDGLHGAQRAVEYLREKERSVQAVICLDMLGDRDLTITIPANGNPALARIAKHAARRIGEPKLVVTDGDKIKDDHVAFLASGYPAIDLIDFSYGPNHSWWHTPEDTMDKVSAESLLKAGRLVCEILNITL